MLAVTAYGAKRRSTDAKKAQTRKRVSRQLLGRWTMSLLEFD